MLREPRLLWVNPMSEKEESEADVAAGPAAVAEARAAVHWVRHAACAGRSAMFDDPARAGEALRLCARCPVLVECRTWALSTAVAGVAGGMAESTRVEWRAKHGFREPVATIAEFLPLTIASADQGRRGKARSDLILRAVAERTAKGCTARQIADDIGVTPRTVQRLRATCRDRGSSGEGSALAG